MARIELLESEITEMKEESFKKKHLRIEDIQDNDKLVSFYTGFISFMVYSAFFEFLGPVVYNLHYCNISGSPCDAVPRKDSGRGAKSSTCLIFF